MNKTVKIIYTNYRGETAVRTIEPKEIIFAENEHYNPAQWLFVTHDVDKNAERTFSMKDIKSWTGE